jgi:intracellular sulfur oxidation DsrE/DsrF family protein
MMKKKRTTKNFKAPSLSPVTLLAPLLVALLGCQVQAAEPDEEMNLGPKTGPIIANMGPYYDIPGGFNLEKGVHYRAVMDVADGPEDAAALNRGIESAARFLNMHAASGIAASDMELALVLHGGAAKAALNNAAYRQRYQSDNPNDALLTALTDAGVTIYLCGQSASFSGFAADEMHPSITMALSAMTVLTRLQIEGWALLP